MRKIVVVGSTGSGKTTLARAVSKKLNIRHTELDSLSWLPGWQQRSAHELWDIVEEITDGPKWVICGNYPKLSMFTIDQADVIVWLDLPFIVCFWQTLKRSLRQILKREKYSNGDQETFVRLCTPKKSIIFWLIKNFKLRNKMYDSMFTFEKDLFFEDKIFVRLKSHKEAKSWLEKL
jgi:Adenylate kinase and related kinases